MRMLRGLGQDDPRGLGQDDPRDLRHRLDTPDVLPRQSWADWLQAPLFGLPTWAVLALGVVGFTMLGGRRR